MYACINVFVTGAIGRGKNKKTLEECNESGVLDLVVRTDERCCGGLMRLGLEVLIVGNVLAWKNGRYTVDDGKCDTS